jgi:hypothetical protein
MRKYITPAVGLAVVSGGWIAYGATHGWGPAAIVSALVIWVAAIGITARQAKRHA